MLPNIDGTPTTTSVGNTGGATTPSVRRPEEERTTNSLPSQTTRDLAQSLDSAILASVTTAPVEETTRPMMTRSETDRFMKQVSGQQDQAEIKLQLTREEREIFLSAMTGREAVSDMSENEQATLQRTSQRIEKLLEEADARKAQQGERLDKALKEWYSRLSNGRQPPADLVELIHQAAMGQLK